MSQPPRARAGTRAQDPWEVSKAQSDVGVRKQLTSNAEVFDTFEIVYTEIELVDHAKKFLTQERS